MIFGYNTDVKSGDVVYHVQTEDRGEKNPVIDSVIYVKGQIVDRRRTRYDPAEIATERLQEMVKQQHRGLVDTIRGGNYSPPAESAAAPSAAAPAGEPHETALELLNPGEIEADGKLVFRLRVRDGPSGHPLGGALIQAVLQAGGGAEARSEATASSDGLAEIAFGRPASEGAAAVVFHATGDGMAAIIKFRLILSS